jgi:uncharacterized protein with ACT and thioredoxin-like domain
MFGNNKEIKRLKSRLNALEVSNSVLSHEIFKNYIGKKVNTIIGGQEVSFKVEKCSIDSEIVLHGGETICNDWCGVFYKYQVKLSRCIVK